MIIIVRMFPISAFCTPLNFAQLFFIFPYIIVRKNISSNVAKLIVFNKGTYLALSNKQKKLILKKNRNLTSTQIAKELNLETRDLHKQLINALKQL